MARVQQIAIAAHKDLLLKDEELCREMRDTLIAISQGYNNHDMYVEIPFNNSKYQAAYMYMYFPALFNSVKYGLDQLNLNPDYWNIDGNDGQEELHLNVCSIGGGPGTDVFGFYEYMKSFLNDNVVNRRLVLNATVIDKYTEWEEAWQTIMNQQPVEDDAGQINLQNYIGYDIAQDVPEEVTETVLNANIILLFKFASAVIQLPTFKRNLTRILTNAPQNSYLIYGDNDADSVTNVVRDIAREAGFRQKPRMYSGKDMKLNTGPNHDLNALSRRYHNQMYQIKSSMIFMVWKKP